MAIPSLEVVIWIVCTIFPYFHTTCCFSSITYLIFTHHSHLSGAGEILILTSNLRTVPPTSMPLANLINPFLLSSCWKNTQKARAKDRTFHHYSGALSRIPWEEFFNLLWILISPSQLWEYQEIFCQDSLWNPDNAAIGCTWKSSNIFNTQQNLKQGVTRNSPSRTLEHLRAGHTCISLSLLPTSGRIGTG